MRRSWFGGWAGGASKEDEAKAEAARLTREADIRRIYEAGTQKEVLCQLYAPEEVDKVIAKIERERELLQLLEEEAAEEAEEEEEEESHHEEEEEEGKEEPNEQEVDKSDNPPETAEDPESEEPSDHFSSSQNEKSFASESEGRGGGNNDGSGKVETSQNFSDNDSFSVTEGEEDKKHDSDIFKSPPKASKFVLRFGSGDGEEDQLQPHVDAVPLETSAAAAAAAAASTRKSFNPNPMDMSMNNMLDVGLDSVANLSYDHGDTRDDQYDQAANQLVGIQEADDDLLNLLMMDDSQDVASGEFSDSQDGSDAQSVASQRSTQGFVDESLREPPMASVETSGAASRDQSGITIGSFRDDENSAPTKEDEKNHNVDTANQNLADVNINADDAAGAEKSDVKDATPDDDAMEAEASTDLIQEDALSDVESDGDVDVMEEDEVMEAEAVEDDDQMEDGDSGDAMEAVDVMEEAVMNEAPDVATTKAGESVYTTSGSEEEVSVVESIEEESESSDNDDVPPPPPPPPVESTDDEEVVEEVIDDSESEVEEVVDDDDAQEFEEIVGDDGDSDHEYVEEEAAKSADEYVTEEEEILSESSASEYADQVIESWQLMRDEEPEDLQAAVSALIAVVYPGEEVDVESMIRRTPLPELYKYLKQQYWYKIHTDKEEAADAAQTVVQETQTELLSIDDLLKGRLKGLIANAKESSRHLMGDQSNEQQNEEGDEEFGEREKRERGLQSLITTVQVSSRALMEDESRRRSQTSLNALGNEFDDQSVEEEEEPVPLSVPADNSGRSEKENVEEAIEHEEGEEEEVVSDQEEISVHSEHEEIVVEEDGNSVHEEVVESDSEVEEEVLEHETDEEEEVVSESDQSEYADQVVESWQDVLDQEVPDDLEGAVRTLFAVVYKDEEVDLEKLKRRTPLPELFKYLKRQYWYKIHTEEEEAAEAAKTVEENSTQIMSVDDMLKGRLEAVLARPRGNNGVHGNPVDSKKDGANEADKSGDLAADFDGLKVTEADADKGAKRTSEVEC